jgi:selenocysteine lyase/cysteine desulfurase
MTTITPAWEPTTVPSAVVASARASSDLGWVRELRNREFARLDDQDQCYLDYTGGALYAASQVREHQELLAGSVLGNPHSTNPASSLATTLADRARVGVLEYFNASPDQYDVVFTPNASGALKLVGEGYRFESGNQLVLSADNHNSVNGIREFARARGATVQYLPLTTPELRLESATVLDALDRGGQAAPGLFAYPAQSNYSGVQHPLAWIEAAHDRGWEVLLDAAAFAPANQLDLGRWQPDFVSLSFYKLFGYPTGIGCLLARHDALSRLRRPWFAGGTIGWVGAGLQRHTLAPGHTGFEDGTIDYLGLPAVNIGLRFLQSIGLDSVHSHVRSLTADLIRGLTSLEHPGGAPMVRIYGPTTTRMRGGTVTFNVLDAGGAFVELPAVEEAAAAARISIRTGCFCNPGASETARGITAADLRRLFDSRRPPSIATVRALLPSRAAGAVRASVGIATVPEDLQRLIELVVGLARRRLPG